MRDHAEVSMRAAIGIRVKSGWGAAVVLGGTHAAPRLILSTRIELSNPTNPFTKQPYHAAQNTLERDEQEIGGRLEKIRAATATSVDGLIAAVGPGRWKPVAVALVVGSLKDPATVTSEHMRAHAYEGRTFWTALRDELAVRGMTCDVHCEKDLPAVVSKKLEIAVDDLKAKVGALGRGITGWRVEQKLAAMGALAGLPCR